MLELEALFTIVAGKIDPLGYFRVGLVDGFTGFCPHDFNELAPSGGQMIPNARQNVGPGCQWECLPGCSSCYCTGDGSFQLGIGFDSMPGNRSSTQRGALHALDDVACPGSVLFQVGVGVWRVRKCCRGGCCEVFSLAVLLTARLRHNIGLMFELS